MHAPLAAGQRRIAAVGDCLLNVRLVRPATPSGQLSWLCKAELNGSLFVVRESDMGALLAEPDGQPNGSG
jgi:hypothetical protein